MTRTWSSIKKKFERNSLLENFVLKLKRDNDLSLERAQKCLEFIITALNMKQIEPNDIIMDDTSIVEIKNFYIDEDGKFELELKKEKKAARSYQDTCSFEFLGNKWIEYKKGVIF